MKYEAFARINAGDDIKHIGYVNARNGRLAKLHARTTFDEEDWDYLAVVCRDDLIEVDSQERPRSRQPAMGRGDGA